MKSEKKLYVLLPSLKLDSPVKGSVALCNKLVKHIPVTIVSLKTDLHKDLHVHPDINIITLEKIANWYRKVEAYRNVLKNSGTKENIISLSYGFSADMVNAFMKKYANIVCSVRENREMNYYYRYGLKGYFYCYLHHLLMKKFEKVAVISDEIFNQLSHKKISNIEKIYNFIDEVDVESYRIEKPKNKDIITFVFIGVLQSRKRPDLLIKTFSDYRKKYSNSFLNIIGDGPLRNEVESLVKSLNLKDHVCIHGFLNKPFTVLQQSDCMILPSESEGVSRACMEALYFDIPCIMRDVDGNRELIHPGINGSLFKEDSDLINSMYEITELVTGGRLNGPLLPEKFRQDYNVRRFMERIVGDKCFD